MEGKVLALIENSIGPRLLLSSRLGALGYAVTLLSAPESFSKRIETETSEWLILGEATTRPVRRRPLELLARHREPQIARFGRPPRDGSVPIKALFDKPLDYREIVRFFSARPSVDPGSARGAATGRGGEKG